MLCSQKQVPIYLIVVSKPSSPVGPNLLKKFNNVE